jgi:hypothetical protein
MRYSIAKSTRRYSINLKEKSFAGLAAMQDIINVSHKYGCIFIHIPKVAGTSIKKVLCLPGFGHPPWQYFYQAHPQYWQKYRSFTVVRNPWDRLVSAYHYAKMRKSFWHNEARGLHPDYQTLRDRSFEDCVSMLKNDRGLLKHESWFEQSLWVMGTGPLEGELMVSTVMRFENLAEDFAGLCAELQIPPRKLPKTNSSKRGRDYRHYYSDSTRRLVGEIYDADIDTFRYTF